MNKMSDVASGGDEDKIDDDGDIPEPTEAMLRNAEVRWYKVQAETVIVDSAVLNWFKAQGADYQDRMNLVLRDYMLAVQSSK
ncbi:BrnA antitoxin family protein [Pseudoduganella sp. LjRoot289]|uniref:BrnA antitoxin family protein n=1 Tax=Pseudoduganella sp. LjRoot289 TaxID=3342314 RepID=UPI003ECFF0E5